MKRIGLLALALVIALGGLGIGYAAWTDTITIQGTVETGSVKLDIVKLSSTYVYKLSDDSMLVRYVLTDAAGVLIHESVAAPTGVEGVDYWDVASAVATADVANNEVTFTYLNVFPSVDFVCDVMLHYSGSVPVKFNNISWVINKEDPDGWFTKLLALALVPGSTEGAVGYARMWDPVTHETGAVVDVGTQLENCDYVKIWFIMHLPQATPMGAVASVTATFDVIQWNEYPPAP